MVIKPLRLVSKVLHKEKIVGYHVLDSIQNKITMYTKQQVKDILVNYNFINATLENGEIKGINLSLDNLPNYSAEGNILDIPKIIVTAEVAKNNEIVGYEIIDELGRSAIFQYSYVIDLLLKYGAKNAKIDYINGVLRVVPNEGKLERKHIKTTVHSTKGSI